MPKDVSRHSQRLLTIVAEETVGHLTCGCRAKCVGEAGRVRGVGEGHCRGGGGGKKEGVVPLGRGGEGGGGGGTEEGEETSGLEGGEDR